MSTTPYLITDSSAESFFKNIQNSLQAAISSTKLNLKNSNKHDYKYSAKSNHSNKQRFRQKLNPVRKYIDKLNDKLSDKVFKVCKICNNKWVEEISISTVKSHFKSKHPLIFKDLQQNSLKIRSGCQSSNRKVLVQFDLLIDAQTEKYGRLSLY
ncbi:16470_t:CDS:2 [Dentiscutata erythropus]|uniref:16470_t:CDS:1 n=1 Tax=Dentiscutata erythropus TaxID=1348616 RepID=A0A9N9HRY2_9GLOM|nr:16470_t:CDS:2 [Dentiscutata erythropus]